LQAGPEEEPPPKPAPISIGQAEALTPPTGSKETSMKQKRTKIFSGTPWEPKVGYARAVMVGEIIHVSGTTGTDPSGKVLAPGDAYAQTVQAIRNIENALKRLGLGLEYVVRTRIFLTQIDRWEEVAKAHAEYFGNVHPATSLIGVNRLVDPEMLVEIEAEAVA
jgi:enamine deaminase RidA (YjgF/YER057c/UK114 family)